MPQPQLLAVTSAQADQLLLRVGDDAAVQAWLDAVAEERGAEWVARIGPWRALDATLAAGPFGRDGRSLPLLGGRRINEGQRTVERYLDPKQVRRLSKRLLAFDRSAFDAAFEAAAPDAEREAVWAALQDLAFLFVRAAAVRDGLVFTAPV
jgi:hypothetical protein